MTTRIWEMKNPTPILEAFKHILLPAAGHYNIQAISFRNRESRSVTHISIINFLDSGIILSHASILMIHIAMSLIVAVVSTVNLS